MEKAVHRVISSNLFESLGSVQWIPSKAHEVQTETLYCRSGGGTVIRSSSRAPNIDIYMSETVPGNISSMAVSPDGDWIATVRENSPDITIWDSDNRAVKYRFEDHNEGVAAVSFSHDSKFLMSVGCVTDRSVFVFDIQNGGIVASSSIPQNVCVSHLCHGGFQKDVKRRPTSSYLMASCGPKHLQPWTFNPLKNEIVSLPLQLKLIRDFTCCAFSSDQELLFAATTTGDIVTVLTKTNTVLGGPCIPVSGSGGVTTVAVDADLLFAGSREGSVCIFKVVNSGLESIRKIMIDKSAFVSSLSAFAGEVLAGMSSGSIYTLASSSTTPVLISHNPAQPISQFVITSSGDSFVSASNEVTRWSLNPTTNPVVLYRCPRSERITCAASNPVLSLIGTSESRIVGIDSNSGSPVWDFPVPFPSKLALTRSMKTCLVGTGDGELRMYDLRTREMKLKMCSHSGRISDLKLFGDESFALTAGRDRNLVTYDLGVERQVTCHRERRSGINAAALLVDQSTVITAGVEKHLVYWDLRIMDPVRMIPVDAEVTCLATLENEVESINLLATGDMAGVVTLWDLKEGRIVERSEIVHAAPVTAVGLMAGKGRAVSAISGGRDNAIVIWSIGGREKENVRAIPPLVTGSLAKLDLSKLGQQ